MALQQLAFLALLAGTALLAEPSARPAASASVIAVGLAIAGLRAASAPNPAGFLAVTAALVVAGIGLAAVAAIRERRAGAGGARPLVGPAAMLAGAVGIAVASARVIGAAPPGLVALSIAVLAVVGLLLTVIGRSDRFRKVGPEHRPPAWNQAHSLRAAGLFLGIVAAGAGPHVGVVIAGAIVAAWSAYLLGRAEGVPGLPWAPLLTLALLAAWWLMATIAGPEGLAVAALPDLPVSPAAERLLALVFLLAAWATAGLWPLHRQAAAGLLAPAGAILLVRIALPTFPDGIEHWRALAMPLVVLGIWHAAWIRRTTALAVGMSWIGLLGGTQAGRLGAGLLLGAVLAAELGRRTGHREPEDLARVVLVVMAGFGGLLATESGLHAEVVYTVLGVAALVVASSGPAAQAMTASDRSTTDAKA